MNATYHGVVRGGIVLLDNGAPLADGTEVHVTPVAKPVANGPAILAALATSPPVPQEWVDELERAIRPKMTVGELHAFLQNLPILGDDADQFAEDVRKIRSGYPPEANPWD